LLVFVIHFDGTDSKQLKNQRKIHTVQRILKVSRKKIREPKFLRLLPNVCDFQKESHTLGYGFKNL
jgi:hypothetical protein